MLLTEARRAEAGWSSMIWVSKTTSAPRNGADHLPARSSPTVTDGESSCSGGTAKGEFEPRGQDAHDGDR